MALAVRGKIMAVRIKTTNYEIYEDIQKAARDLRERAVNLETLWLPNGLPAERFRGPIRLMVVKEIGRIDALATRNTETNGDVVKAARALEQDQQYDPVTEFAAVRTKLVEIRDWIDANITDPPYPDGTTVLAADSAGLSTLLVDLQALIEAP